MKTIDLHQDLMTHIRFRDVFGQSEQTSFELIAGSDLDTVIVTAFPMPPGDDQHHHTVSVLITEELQMYHDFVESQKQWSIVKKGADLDVGGKKLLLHIEGLNVFDGTQKSWNDLEKWHELGVRSIGTHWNLENALGGGTLQPEIGLTTLGAEVVEYIERKNMALDMAHMGRKTFWDVANLTTRPLYVSHGNADAVCSNVRNYTDEQLYKIAESGGVVGVFFPNTFVTGKEVSGCVEDVIAHIVYIKNLIGVEHIAIGSDFGGIVTGTVEGLASVADVSSLWTSMQTCGFNESELEAVAYNNAYRILQAHLE